MKKHKYISPTIKLIAIKNNHVILSGSEVESLTGGGTDSGDNVVVRAKRYSVWDDTENQ